MQIWNIVLTTLPPILILTYSRVGCFAMQSDVKIVHADDFRANIRNRWIFSGGKFTYWVIGGLYHGFVAFWIVMFCFKSIQYE